MKRYSTSSVLGENASQNEILFTPTNMSIIKMTDNNKCGQGYGGIGTLYIASGNVT